METQPIINNQQNIPVGADYHPPVLPEPIVPKPSLLLPIILSSLTTILFLVAVYFLFLNNKPQNIATIPSPSPIASVMALESADPTTGQQTSANNSNLDEKTLLENFVKDNLFTYGKAHNLNLVSVNQVAVRIDKLQGNFATGGSGYPQELNTAGEIWFAAKVNGQWTMVEKTQDLPECAKLTQFQFPQSMYGECF